MGSSSSGGSAARSSPDLASPVHGECEWRHPLTRVGNYCASYRVGRDAGRRAEPREKRRPQPRQLAQQADGFRAPGAGLVNPSDLGRVVGRECVHERHNLASLQATAREGTSRKFGVRTRLSSPSNSCCRHQSNAVRATPPSSRRRRLPPGCPPSCRAEAAAQGSASCKVIRRQQATATSNNMLQLQGHLLSCARVNYFADLQSKYAGVRSLSESYSSNGLSSRIDGSCLTYEGSLNVLACSAAAATASACAGMGS